MKKIRRIKIFTKLINEYYVKEDDPDFDTLVRKLNHSDSRLSEDEYKELIIKYSYEWAASDVNFDVARYIAANLSNKIETEL